MATERRADHHRPGRRPRGRALRAAHGARARRAASRSSRRPATPNRPCGRCSGTSRRSSCSTSTCRASSARSTPYRACRRCRPNTHVVILTMQEDPEFARRALRAGAAGYVLKEAADDELVDAVRRVADGRHVPQSAPGCGARRRAAGAFGAAGRPHRARGRGPAADRPGPHERRDRRGALPLGAHGRVASRPHPAEAQPLHAARSWFATRWTTGSSKPG